MHDSTSVRLGRRVTHHQTTKAREDMICQTADITDMVDRSTSGHGEEYNVYSQRGPQRGYHQ
jgi:hypothetical protein